MSKIIVSLNLQRKRVKNKGYSMPKDVGNITFTIENENQFYNPAGNCHEDFNLPQTRGQIGATRFSFLEAELERLMEHVFNDDIVIKIDKIEKINS